MTVTCDETNTQTTFISLNPVTLTNMKNEYHFKLLYLNTITYRAILESRITMVQNVECISVIKECFNDFTVD